MASYSAQERQTSACATADIIRPGDPPGGLNGALPTPAYQDEVQRLLALTTFLRAPALGDWTERPLGPPTSKQPMPCSLGARRPSLPCILPPRRALAAGASSALPAWLVRSCAAMAGPLWSWGPQRSQARWHTSRMPSVPPAGASQAAHRFPYWLPWSPGSSCSSPVLLVPLTSHTPWARPPRRSSATPIRAHMVQCTPARSACWPIQSRAARRDQRPPALRLWARLPRRHLRQAGGLPRRRPLGPVSEPRVAAPRSVLHGRQMQRTSR